MSKKEILIVEDERIIAEDIKRTLQDFGYRVEKTLQTGEDAIKYAEENDPALVLMDIHLDGKLTGIEAAQIINDKFDIPFVYLTAYADEKTLKKAKITQPFGYVLKPFEDRELHATIEMAFYKYKMEKNLKENKIFLRQVIDTNPNYIYVKDKDGKYIMVNQTFVELMDCNYDDIINKTDEELAPSFLLNEEEVQKFINYNKNENSLEKKYLTEKCFLLKDNKEKWLQISKVPLKIEDRSDNVLGVIVDVTDKKRAEIKLKASNKKLKKLLNATVDGLVSAVEMRDPYTAGHQKRVAKLSVAIAKELGLSKDRIDGIRMASRLHDLGKMYIPSEILTKPGPLTESEYNLIKMHPETGYDVLKDIDFPWPIAKMVLQHHERIDGSGYPDHLSGEDIIIEAQIIGLADTIEAITSHRPYRETLGVYTALKEVSEDKGVLFRPHLVDVATKLFKENKFEF